MTISGWVCRRPALRIVVELCLCLALTLRDASALSAAELYSNGDTELRWDNTISYSTAFRLRDPDPALLGNRNADDGDRNFAPGVVSNRFDLFSQFDLSKAWFGIHASGAAWYDTVYHQKNDNNSPATFNPVSVPHNEFTHAVQTLHGAKAELVDAFLYGNTELGGLPFSFRIGRHTLLWGETVFFTENGIAAGQAPVDDIKVLGRPTTYAKDVFMPVAQVSASLQLPAGFAVEGYYQFEWRKTRLPGSGSYLSSSDYYDVGGERYLLRSGNTLLRGPDQTPPDSGQFGAALRWSTDEVDYGLYALRFNAKDPKIYYRSDLGTFNLVYPRGIEIYGASASGYIGNSNIAAELSGRRNMPLVNSLLFLPSGQTADAYNNPRYPVGDTLHAQLSTITTFARTPVWDSANLNAEFAATQRLKVTKNAADLDPSDSKLAVAFRGTFEPTYFEVLPNLDVTLSLGLGYNLAGNSITDSYQKQGAGDLDFGVTATYRVVWVGSITFTHFLGNADRQVLADRDFIRFAIQRTF
ncbi:MAG TPA: DUF1302 family protein [Micropepsaceae bacterium]|nr:DUF1302 family protein [Micropepsaceae bacterium]